MSKMNFGKSVTFVYLSLLIAALVFSILPTHIEAQGGTTISVIPPTNSYSVFDPPDDSTFTVNATLTDVIDLCLWQLVIVYDPSMLNCTSAVIPPDSLFNLPIQPGAKYNSTGGYLFLGASTLTTGVNGSGVLAKLTFKIIKAPVTEGDSLTCNISAGEAWHSAPSPQLVRTYLENSTPAEMPFSAINATFQYTWPKFTSVEHKFTVDEEDYSVITDINCSLTKKEFNETLFKMEKTLHFEASNVTSSTGEVGSINVTIPKNFMWGSFNVTVGTTQVTPEKSENDTHTILRFTVPFSSTKSVIITAEHVVPEFPSGLIAVTAFFAVTLVAVAFATSKRKALLKFRRE